ncbi:MAG: hypothetical protein FD143_1983 [Ignavibacteria bacterium]|nr:MAG: hypothetical protein FD143_1983 [Ignavibacteria bacterium]KAF0159304.1 MAG: hypothetical protein FD188_2251 [Ignavibacteria bacterium]
MKLSKKCISALVNKRFSDLAPKCLVTKRLSSLVPNCLSKRIYFAAVAAIISMLLLESCSYSFSGASVPPHLKTIFITVFQDRSGSGEFNLGDRVTKQLTQKFIGDNTLTVSSRTGANAILDGSITSLTDAPSAISGGEKVTTRRVTLNVQVIYKDIVKKTTIFERSFSNYGDYTIGGDITNARKAATEEAIEKITEDILLGVVSNW